MRCEDLIQKITTNGGKVLEEIIEKNGNNISAHKVILQLNNTYYKLSFLNVFADQVEAIKLYKYGVDDDWKELKDESIK